MEIVYAQCTYGPVTVDHFPVEPVKHQKSRDTPPASSIVNPATIRNHYNIPETLMGQSAQNSHSVAEFDNQWYDPTDLSLFFQRNNLPDTPVAKVRANIPLNEALLNF